MNPDRGEVPFMEEQFSIKVLESANPIYTVLRGVCISEAISLRWAVKKFDLFIVGVARRESPIPKMSRSPISRVLWGVPNDLTVLISVRDAGKCLCNEDESTVRCNAHVPGKDVAKLRVVRAPDIVTLKIVEEEVRTLCCQSIICAFRENYKLRKALHRE